MADCRAIVLVFFSLLILYFSLYPWNNSHLKEEVGKAVSRIVMLCPLFCHDNYSCRFRCLTSFVPCSAWKVFL